MSRLLNDALRLDIFDLNYAYGSEMVALLSRPPTALPKRGIAVRIGAFFWHFLKSLKELNSLFNNGRAKRGSILFFARTMNQMRALAPVLERMSDAYLLGGSPYGIERNDVVRFPWFIAYLLSLVFLPLVLLHFWRARGYRRETFYYNFDRYWLTYGCYISAGLWLGQLAPAALVVSNDHNMPHRVMVEAAKRSRIPTFYLQHASVTKRFPPLAFDYALLEGLDALEKYERAGASPTTVFLIGMPKADGSLEYANQNSTVCSVGVCTNKLDRIPRIEHLCARLHREFPRLSFVLRPHPADRRESLWSDIARRFGMQLSDSRVEPSFDFLRQVDVIIAGDSNILLESALMNVFPIYYDFAHTNLDWYGFQRNGLVAYSSAPPEVCGMIEGLIKAKPPVRMRAKAYCATVGTRYDGRSGELASALVQQLASGKGVNLDDWRRIPGVQLEAYQLVDQADGELID